MSAVVAFVPPVQTPFQFQAVLDGTAYNVIVTWALFGQRWYVNCYQQDGTLVFALPLISSPDNSDISLTAGYFTSTLVFRDSTQQFEIFP